MLRHFLALVVGQRFAQRSRNGVQGPGESAGGDIRLARGHPHQDDIAGCAFHQRADRTGPSGTHNEVALPMARHQTALDFLRPVLDIGHAAELAAALAAFWLATAVWLVLAQARDQLAAQFAARQGVDRGVDRLVRHTQARLLLHSMLDPLAPARYLLRGPFQAQQPSHFTKQRAIARQPRFAARPAPAGKGLGLRRVRQVPRGIAMPLDLSRNRPRRSAEGPGNRSDPPAVMQTHLNHRAINNRQPTSRNCHPTTLNCRVTRWCSLPNLNSAHIYHNLLILNMILTP